MINGIIYLALNQVNGKIYVGKTAGSLEGRIRRHIRGALFYKDANFFSRALRKYGPDNFTWEVIDHPRVAFLNHKERTWIKRFRAAGYELYNCTDGGEGMLNPSPETRKKLSLSVQKSWVDPKVRKKRGDIMRKVWADPKARKRLGESIRKAYINPVVRAKISGKNNGMKRPEIAARCGEAVRKAYADPEVRVRLSTAIKKMWARPEFQIRMSMIMKRAMARPEVKARQRATWARPEVKARHSMMIKRHWLVSRRTKPCVFKRSNIRT